MAGIQFDVAGPAKGPTVLLSSGLGGAAAYWTPQMPALLDAGYRVVTYDHRGTGRSHRDLPERLTIADLAADVREVMDASDTASCHVVGHALGGLVGLQLALDVPTRIETLTLVNAWSRPNPHSARCFDARLALLAAGGARAYVEAQPIFLYPADWCVENADRVQEEVEHAISHFPGEASLRARIAALRAFDLDLRLSEIHQPVLVAAATDDTLVPWTCSQRLAAGLPLALLARVPHGGHAHTVTQADVFNRQLLGFLEEFGKKGKP